MSDITRHGQHLSDEIFTLRRVDPKIGDNNLLKLFWEDHPLCDSHFILIFLSIFSDASFPVILPVTLGVLSDISMVDSVLVASLVYHNIHAHFLGTCTSGIASNIYICPSITANANIQWNILLLCIFSSCVYVMRGCYWWRISCVVFMILLHELLLQAARKVRGIRCILRCLLLIN